MPDMHGLIYAYHSNPALGELVTHRTSASLPFCSRYRLIDFALSAMTNAGVRDVGVIMQRDYQSLLDHLGSGKDWDMSRSSGGLCLLPPFGMHDSRIGEYRGCMEALAAERSYIRDIKQNTIVLYRGDIVANIDLRAAYAAHLASGCEVTAVCADQRFPGIGERIRFLPDSDRTAKRMLFPGTDNENALSSAEIYIIQKRLLLELIDWCRSNGRLHFHRDALAHYLESGAKIGLYMHHGYLARIASVNDYYRANLDMLDFKNRADIFPAERPVYTRVRSSVSTYYGAEASARNSLVADGCFIEGSIENCVLCRGVRVKKDAHLKNCILMQDTVVGEHALLQYVVADKYASFSDGMILSGSSMLPLTVPKGKTL
ncbi:MAG: glucose-1-phosphate adenylyltransferase subunit GlgD [Oscillospiraceae bacterium]|jgi:glucose-1-phosphate adenylyltransferase